MNTHRRVATGDIRKSTVGSAIATWLYYKLDAGQMVETGSVVLTKDEQRWHPVSGGFRIVAN